MTWMKKRGGVTLDRLLKRYFWIELFFGLAVIATGMFLGGTVLLALGGCMLALSVRCFAEGVRHGWGSAAFGVVTLLYLVWIGTVSFFDMTSLSRYADQTSPLAVLFVLALVLLGQIFLSLPTEDQPYLIRLRKEITTLTVFCGVGFVGILLIYLLAFLLFGSALSAMENGGSVPDFHYLEGILALSMALAGARSVLSVFLKKKSSDEVVAEEEDV